MMEPRVYAASPSSFIPYLYGSRAPVAETPSPEIGLPITGRLTNGALNCCQQMVHQELSHLSIMLPISTMDSGSRLLIPGLLLQGSQATKDFLNQCRTRGIEFTVSPLADRFLLQASGPAGQETDILQSALSVLTCPVIDAYHFATLKDNLVKNIQNGLTDPAVPLAEATIKALFGEKHPYGKTSREELQDLSAQTLSSVMATYKQAMAFPEMSIFSLISPQPVEAQEALLNQGIRQSNWYASPYRQGSLDVLPPVDPKKGARGPLLVPNETLKRAYIFQAWRAPVVNDPDYLPFCLMLEMLKGFSGGFFKALRTARSLVYGVQQAYLERQQAGSYQVMVREVETKRIGEAMDAMQEVVTEMVDKPVSPQRLWTAKEDFIRQLNTMKQSSAGLASFNQPWLQSGLPPLPPQALKAAIERITPADLQRVATRFLTPQNGYTVLGISAPKSILNQQFKPPIS